MRQAYDYWQDQPGSTSSSTSRRRDSHAPASMWHGSGGNRADCRASSELSVGTRPRRATSLYRVRHPRPRARARWPWKHRARRMPEQRGNAASATRPQRHALGAPAVRQPCTKHHFPWVGYQHASTCRESGMVTAATLMGHRRRQSAAQRRGSCRQSRVQDNSCAS